MPSTPNLLRELHRALFWYHGLTVHDMEKILATTRLLAGLCGMIPGLSLLRVIHQHLSTLIFCIVEFCITDVTANRYFLHKDRREFEVKEILAPWSVYEFRVAAGNELGLGLASAASPYFNTQPDKPYIPPRNIGGGGGKIGDLTITWKVSRLAIFVNSNGISTIWFHFHCKALDLSIDL